MPDRVRQRLGKRNIKDGELDFYFSIRLALSLDQPPVFKFEFCQYVNILMDFAVNEWNKPMLVERFLLFIPEKFVVYIASQERASPPSSIWGFSYCVSPAVCACALRDAKLNAIKIHICLMKFRLLD